jgi:hypothetical protein
MSIHSRSQPITREGKLLDRLARARGLKRYAFFFVTGEDDLLPNGVETSSGFVIDDHGRVFSFWTGWDMDCQEPTFSDWERIEPEPGWENSREYRQARQQVGLE